MANRFSPTSVTRVPLRPTHLQVLQPDNTGNPRVGHTGTIPEVQAPKTRTPTRFFNPASVTAVPFRSNT